MEVARPVRPRPDSGRVRGALERAWQV